MKIHYMVSWAFIGGLCGNWSFDTVAEMESYIEQNCHAWRSYSRWVATPENSFISRLDPYQP